MKSFVYSQPTEIRYGRGRVAEIGQAVARHGKRCLIVSEAPRGYLQGHLSPLLDRIQASLRDAGIDCAHYGGVVPNPTTASVTAGAELARQFQADVVLGVGGGSSMDTAKAIAVEAVHPGTCWDYLFFKTPPTERTLPVIAVSTTSGTGSHVTQVAVVTQPETRTKSALYNALLYPKVVIVDPELMHSVPPHVTASTGFDVFCHAFESILHPGASPYTDLLAWEAIRLVVDFLPTVVDDGADAEGRDAMAWADTLAGLCIAQAGVTLPHGIGMTIGGQCPQVMHGEALAVIYPAFTRFTSPYAVHSFATVGRIMNPELDGAPEDAAAGCACEEIDRFLRRIGMWLSLEGLGVSQADVVAIADNSRVLPDYKNNPRLASRDEIYDLLAASYRR
jgi:alcohol dehydrogenase class IV